MKRLFHTPWSVTRRVTGIAMCLLGLAVLSPSLQADGAVSPRSVSPEQSIKSVRSTAAHQSDILAPAAVQQFAHDQAMALGSSQKSGNGWNQAELDFYPLGPGTHSWLVYANVEGKTVGYMIISATEQGNLQLSEYGQGEQLPYSSSLLNHSLERQHLNLNELFADGGELHLRYAPPLLAYWKVERSGAAAIFIDATNGDTLPNGVLNALEADLLDERPRYSITPISGRGTSNVTVADPSKSSSLTADPMYLQHAFNPAHNLIWITSKAVSAPSVQGLIQQWKQHKKIVFSADDRNVLYGGPLSVSGYQIWRNDRDTEQIQYVAIGGETSIRRFVPLSTLLRDGHFYTLKP